MMNKPKEPVRRWNPWPAAIVAFFAVAIVGCAGFVAFCVLHPTDLVRPDYYEQELRYQAELDRIGRARQLGDAADVTLDGSSGRLLVRLPVAHARASGDIHLYRPSGGHLDRRIELRLDAEGKQSVDAVSLAPGLWQVKVRWRFEGQDYSMDERIVVKPATAPTSEPNPPHPNRA